MAWTLNKDHLTILIKIDGHGQGPPQSTMQKHTQHQHPLRRFQLPTGPQKLCTQEYYYATASTPELNHIMYSDLTG